MKIVANPINSFVAGCIAALTIIFSKRLDPNVFPQNILIGFMIAVALTAFFLFVVRDHEYKLKLWYGFRELTTPRLFRGLAWIGGVALIVLASELLQTAT